MRISDWSSDVCSSDLLVNTYKQGGWLPEWASPGYRNVMIGSNSANLIADAYFNGVRGFDVERLLYLTSTSLSTGGIERQRAVDEAKQVMKDIDERYRSEEHTSELQSLMRRSYAVFCLKKKNKKKTQNIN